MKIMIEEISAKFNNHRHNKEHSKDLIIIILRQNEKDLNLVLNKTFREMLEIYYNDNINNYFQIFQKIKR